MTTHRQRIEDCLSNGIPDRPPVALWRHFPVDDQTPASLAKATLAYQRAFDFDLVKVTPSSSYCLKDWGVEDEWRGATEGTREYTRRVIERPEDWGSLPVLDPEKAHLGAELECLRLLVKELGSDTPVIQTIFNPLSQAKNLAGGEKLLVHARRYPEALLAGLETITKSTVRFIEAAQKTGIAGVFFAVQHAQFGLMSESEYMRFGRPFDLQTLEPASMMWIKMMHLHGTDVMFDLMRDYPTNIINWHDRDTSPSLSQALANYSGAVCGGVSRATLVYRSPADIRREAAEAIEATGGRRFILGTGCVAPIITPLGNTLALRQSVLESV